MNKPNIWSFLVGLCTALVGVYLLFNPPTGLSNSTNIALGIISLGGFFVFNSFRGKKVSSILNENMNNYEINAPQNRNAVSTDITRYMPIVALLICIALGLLVNFIFPSVGLEKATLYPFGFALMLWGVYSIIKREVLLGRSMPAVWLRGTSAVVTGVILIISGFYLLNMLGAFTQIFSK